MFRRHAIYVWALLVFFLSELVAAKLGVRFAAETLGRLYQYLDPVILREDLLAGLYYLHAQPPLFNLGLGIVLKLFPDPAMFEAVFSLLFGAMALGLLIAMTWLLRAFGVSDGVIAVVCLAFALAPNFLVYRSWLFYTLPVALLLAGCAICLECRAYALFCALSGVLMLTRSVFHPLWFVSVTTVVWLTMARADRRRLIMAAAAALIVVNAWFLKNQLVVGSYAASTWLGMSLAKRWPISQREMAELKAEGVLPPYWHRRPFQEPSELERFGFFGDEGVGVDDDEPHAAAHPAIDAPYKSNGEPNFNHRDYIEISEGMLDGDLALVRRYPARYAERVVTALLLYLQPGPNSVHFLVDYDFGRVHRYRDALTRYVFLGGGFDRPIRMFDPPPNLMLVIFPLVLLVGASEIRRGRSRATHAFMLASVLFVTAVTTLIEIGENDRMRWEVEPFLAVWLGLALEAARRRLSSSSAAGKA